MIWCLTQMLGTLESLVWEFFQHCEREALRGFRFYSLESNESGHRQAHSSYCRLGINPSRPSLETWIKDAKQEQNNNVKNSAHCERSQPTDHPENVKSNCDCFKSNQNNDFNFLTRNQSARSHPDRLKRHLIDQGNVALLRWVLWLTNVSTTCGKCALFDSCGTLKMRHIPTDTSYYYCCYYPCGLLVVNSQPLSSLNDDRQFSLFLAYRTRPIYNFIQDPLNLTTVLLEELKKKHHLRASSITSFPCPLPLKRKSSKQRREALIKGAYASGNLLLIKWFHLHGYRLLPNALTYMVQHGHPHLLQWYSRLNLKETAQPARERSSLTQQHENWASSFASWTLTKASSASNFLQNTNTPVATPTRNLNDSQLLPLTASISLKTTSANHLQHEIMSLPPGFGTDLLQVNSIPRSEKAALSQKYRAILKWLLHHPKEEISVSILDKKSSFLINQFVALECTHTVQWLFCQGYTGNTTTTSIAVETGNLDLVKWCLSPPRDWMSTPPMEYICAKAAKSGNLQLLQWLFCIKQCPIDANTWSMALKGSHWSILMWLASALLASKFWKARCFSTKDNNRMNEKNNLFDSSFAGANSTEEEIFVVVSNLSSLEHEANLDSPKEVDIDTSARGGRDHSTLSLRDEEWGGSRPPLPSADPLHYYEIRSRQGNFNPCQNPSSPPVCIPVTDSIKSSWWKQLLVLLPKQHQDVSDFYDVSAPDLPELDSSERQWHFRQVARAGNITLMAWLFHFYTHPHLFWFVSQNTSYSTSTFQLNREQLCTDACFYKQYDMLCWLFVKQNCLWNNQIRTTLLSQQRQDLVEWYDNNVKERKLGG